MGYLSPSCRSEDIQMRLFLCGDRSDSMTIFTTGLIIIVDMDFYGASLLLNSSASCEGMSSNDIVM